MKKALLFAILALSINAFAQNKRPTSISMEDVRRRMENTGIKTSDIHYERNLGQTVEHQMPNQRSLIQIYDSVYWWYYDTLSPGWKISYKSINYAYDSNHNLISYKDQGRNGSIWVNSEQCTYTYDANNNLTSELDQTWSGTAWVNNYQSTYTYNASDKMTSELDQTWSDTVWVNYRQYLYTYDANNNLTIELDQDWNGSAWENNKQYTCTYDANNNLTSELDQDWNGSTWVNSWLTTYTYDANNNRASELDQDWNGSAWVNSFQFTFTCDANNNLTFLFGRHWNGSAWVQYYQIFYTYDANNNLTNELDQNWNGSVWWNCYQFIDTYDANNFTISWSYKDFYATGKIMEGDSTLNYFHTVLGINDLKVRKGSTTIYPDPSLDKITIETPEIPTKSQLSILNLNGQKIITRQITEPKTIIDISNLPSGIYFVRLLGENKVVMGKFIKQ